MHRYLVCQGCIQHQLSKVDIQSPGVQAFVDERHNKRVLGIAFSWRFQKGSDTKESRRKKEIDETKRVNL